MSETMLSPLEKTIKIAYTLPKTQQDSLYDDGGVEVHTAFLLPQFLIVASHGKEVSPLTKQEFFCKPN